MHVFYVGKKMFVKNKIKLNKKQNLIPYIGIKGKTSLMPNSTKALGPREGGGEPCVAENALCRSHA